MHQQEATQLLPDNAHYLSLLSKQWSDITFIPSTPNAEAKSCAEKGLAIAEEVWVSLFRFVSQFVCWLGRFLHSKIEWWGPRLHGTNISSSAALQSVSACRQLRVTHGLPLLQAVAKDPNCPMAHIAAGVAKGRLTFFVDNRRKVLS